MEPKAEKLRREVKTLSQELKNAQKDLTNYVSSCSHEFTEPIYDPINSPAYTCRGDPPGTMGVDWRGPIHVPAKTEKRWRRECGTCGEVQYTGKTDKTYTEKPNFGGRR